jgi:hypothetical protein
MTFRRAYASILRTVLFWLGCRIPNRKSAHGVTAAGAVFALAILFIASTPGAYAQTATGEIHGNVTDVSDAAMPGVSITLTSPALLVDQSATTDASGIYHFIQLPPGTYKMTLTREGFQQFVRDNIEITPGFSAAVNVQMVVGAVSQTVEVESGGPVVDTSSAAIATELSNTVMADELPITREAQEILRLLPGVQPTAPVDTGGGLIANGAAGAVYGQIGQPNDYTEGVNNRYFTTSIGDTLDFTALETFDIITIGAPADVQLPGVYFNGIYKTGGNSFHGRLEVTGETDKLEGNNLTPALRATSSAASPNGFYGFSPITVNGVTNNTPAPQRVLNSTDASANMGGYIIKNKWWFFGGAHVNSTNKSAIGFVDANNNQLPTYTRTTNNEAKTTYQLNDKYKLVGFWGMYTEYIPFRNGSQTTPPLSTVVYTWPIWNLKGEFIAAFRPNLLLDVFVARHHYEADYTAHADPMNIPTMQNLNPAVGETLQPVQGPTLGQDHRPRDIRPQITGNLTWIPSGAFLGHHEFKFGAQYGRMSTGTTELKGVHGNYQLIFNGGKPYQVWFYNYPVPNNVNDLIEGGSYVTDTWRMTRRLTTTVGLRLDTFKASVPAQTKPAGQYGGATAATWIQAPGGDPFVWTGTATNQPYFSAGTWNVLAPRVGVAYDLLGNGKTLLKLSYGRYNLTPGDDYASAYNLDTAVVTEYHWNNPPQVLLNGVLTTCTYEMTAAPTAGCDYASTNPANGQHQVDLNPNLAACGSYPNAGYGTTCGDYVTSAASNNAAVAKFPNSQYNPNLHEQYQAQYHIGIEHQIGNNISARASFTYVNDPDTWTQFSIGQPYGDYLPAGGGTAYTGCDRGPLLAPTSFKAGTSTCPTGTVQTFTLYSINPADVTISNTLAETFNQPSSRDPHFQTIETTVTKRSGSGAHRWNMLATFSATKNHRFLQPATSGTAAVGYEQNPNQLINNLDTHWDWTAHVSGGYTLPSGKLLHLDLAGTYQILNGLLGARTDNFTGIGVTGTVPVLVSKFGSISGPIRQITSIRISRDLRTEKHGTFRPTVEILNLFNTSGYWAINFTSGTKYGNVTSTDTPRLIRAGLVYSF